MRWRTPFTLTTLLMALAPAPAAAQGGTDAADTREVQAYRLSMPKLTLLNQAIEDALRQRESDPAYKGLRSKKQELARLGEKENPTDADQERMAELEEEIREAEEAADGPEDADQSLSGMARRMAADPIVSGALRRAGLAPREAATMQLALIQVALAVGMKEAGHIKEIPKDVNPDNVRFYQANRAAIEALTALRSEEEEEEE